MALFRRPTPTSTDPVLDLVAHLAPTVFPGATVDVAERRLQVPVPGGRAGVDLDRLLAAADGQTAEQTEHLVRSWLTDLVPQLRGTQVPDPAAVAPQPQDLRLRVVPAWSPADRAAVACSPVPHSFDAVVAHPDPQGRPAYLTVAVADAHLGGAQQAVLTAVANTAPAELFDMRVSDHTVDGHALRMLSKPGNPFVTTALLSLPRFLPEQPAGGALVLAPTYSEVILRAVTTRSDLDAIPMLAAMAGERAAASPEPCSTAVHWWHDGTFWPLEASPDGRVTLPAALQPVVQTLA